MTDAYAIGDTIRSTCGQARITYHPDWDRERPWVSYYRGTAGRHYHSAYLGVRDMKYWGYRFDSSLSIKDEPPREAWAALACTL